MGAHVISPMFVQGVVFQVIFGNTFKTFITSYSISAAGSLDLYVFGFTLMA